MGTQRLWVASRTLSDPKPVSPPFFSQCSGWFVPALVQSAQPWPPGWNGGETVTLIFTWGSWEWEIQVSVIWRELGLNEIPRTLQRGCSLGSMEYVHIPVVVLVFIEGVWVCILIFKFGIPEYMLQMVYRIRQVYIERKKKWKCPVAQSTHSR